MTSPNEIKTLAQNALPEASYLLSIWLPDGATQGGEYVARNPTREDHHPGSFKVNLTTGFWSDFATGDKGGDLVSLYAYLNQLSQGEAARCVAEQIGLLGTEDKPDQQQTPSDQKELVWKIITPIPASADKAKPHPRYGKPSQTWAYRDTEGRLIGYACRFNVENGGKVVLPLTYWEATEGDRRWQQWRWKAFRPPRPLYGLDRLAARPDAPVLVVEGEKTADAALLLFPQYVAVTSPGGCKGVEKADWSPLEGRPVIISSDFDEEGRIYGDAVAQQSRKVSAKSVDLLVWPTHLVPEDGKLVPRDGNPKKGYDLADAVLEGWTPELLAERTDLLTSYPKAEGSPDPIVPLQSLSTDSSPDEIESALRKYAQTIEKSDKLKIAICREKAILRLEELRIKRATALVNAALATIIRNVSPNDDQSVAISFREVDPWENAVDGDTLLDEITALISKYLVLPPHAPETISLWIIHTHALDAAFISPILAILSPVKRCGKTTLLSVLTNLVPRCLSASNISPAALFRSIEKYRPTMLVDEADTFLSRNDELRGIFNAGHSRKNAFVVRTVGEKHEPKNFSVWGAKGIAMIGKLPSTMEDRSIVVLMKRKLSGEEVAKYREDRIGSESEVLLRKCKRWAKDYLEELKSADPEVPKNLNDRAADNWRPLLGIADLAGGTWPEKARLAALNLSGEANAPDDSTRVQLLSDLRDLFTSENTDRLSSERIMSVLGDMEERAWSEWKNGKPITKRQVAGLLKSFGIEPKNIKFDDGKVLKGYMLENFSDVFLRYLPIQSATALPALIDNNLEQNQSATKSTTVADENLRNSLQNNNGSAVADREGGIKENSNNSEGSGTASEDPAPEEEEEWTG